MMHKLRELCCHHNIFTTQLSPPTPYSPFRVGAVILTGVEACYVYLQSIESTNSYLFLTKSAGESLHLHQAAVAAVSRASANIILWVVPASPIL